MTAPAVPRTPGPDLPPEAYRRMAGVLRAGLAAALIAFVAGLVADLALRASSRWSPGAANPYRGYLSPAGLAAGLAAGAPVAYLTLAVLLLVATPLARVCTGLYYFERHGERAIAAIALAVFLLLLFGLFLLGPLVR